MGSFNTSGRLWHAVFLRRGPVAPALLVCAVGLASLGGCDDLEQKQELLCPSYDIFANNVSAVMERRCGMLDCHGTQFRPMRLYGELGLRHPGQVNRTGEAGTTKEERRANYESICGVEPDRMNQVTLDQGQSAQQLLLVRKARGKEGHKGGQVFAPNDAFDVCITGWLQSRPEIEVSAACSAALDRLP